MSELILHHYDTSPFSEKFRLVLGMKGLSWASVKVPRIMPKPDVVALTGGYRRTPFMQIGADVYCDTALMCRVVDALHPNPPLYPAEATPMQHVIAQWADSALFWTAVPYTMQPAGLAVMFEGAPPEAVEAFGADRAAMTQGMRRPTTVDARAQLLTYLGWMEGLLADGRAFLLGAKPCIADFSVVQSLWFMRRVPEVAKTLEPFPRLQAWRQRVADFGHGNPRKMGSDEAIALAAATSAFAPCGVAPDAGFAAGSAVTVGATDYATDLVAGTLVGLNDAEVVIERRDERAGTLHVHFPRIGFQVKAQAAAEARA
jgi:glutathione S-transferase